MTPPLPTSILFVIWLTPGLLSVIAFLLIIIGTNIVRRTMSIERTQRHFIVAMLQLTIELHPDKAERVTAAFSRFIYGKDNEEV